MARAANDQGLALASNHRLDPGRLFGLSSTLQVLQRPDVVDLDMLVRAAELAFVRQQSLLQVRPVVVPDASRLIGEDCIPTMLERYPAPVGDQRRLAGSLDHDPQARVDALGCLKDGPVALVDFSDADLQLGRQRLDRKSTRLNSSH